MSHAVERYVHASNFTPRDLDPCGLEMRLVCRSCGARQSFDVGRVLIDPEYVATKRGGQPPDDACELADYIFFSGYLRCRKCRATDWDFTPEAMLQITALIMEVIVRPQGGRIHLARCQLFDGTRMLNSAQAEDYLVKLLEQTPDDAFLWTRLANVYETAGMEKECLAANRKALECDPNDVEANYHVGSHLAEEGRTEAAARHFRAVLQGAQQSWLKEKNRELLDDVTKGAIEWLASLYRRSGGTIEGMLPPFDPPAAEPGSQPSGARRTAVTEIDLDSDEGREVLSRVYIEGRVPEWFRRRAAERAGDVTVLEQFGEFVRGLRGAAHPPEPRPADRPASPASVRTGRNDPCPCGSGKKHKKCCGRS